MSLLMICTPDLKKEIGVCGEMEAGRKEVRVGVGEEDRHLQDPPPPVSPAASHPTVHASRPGMHRRTGHHDQGDSGGLSLVLVVYRGVCLQVLSLAASRCSSCG